MAISLTAIIITNLATQQQTPPCLWIITLIFLILTIPLYIIGYGQGFEKILAKLAQHMRSKRFSKPRVLILDGTINGDKQEMPPNPAHTNKTPTDWRTALESTGWEVELGPSKRINERPTPDIVINPFGEVYPESNFMSSPSILEIRNFVWSGGVYVNVAGIPFWYRYDPFSRTRENAGRIEKLFEDKPIWKSLFYDLFPNLTPSSDDAEVVECVQIEEDVKRFGDIANAGGMNRVGKFRAYPLNPPQLIPILRENGQQNCIIGSFLYGQGCYLFAGVFMNENNFSFEKVLAAIKGWASFESRNRTP